LNVLLSGTAAGGATVQLGNVHAVSGDGNAVAISTKGGQIVILPSNSAGITPSATVLFPSQIQQFTAAVIGGSGNTAVTWTLSPNLGTISTSGLYTAPATIVTAPQTVLVTATSVADATKSASAIITLLVPVSVTITPAATKLFPGQAQQFTATVTGGTGNTAVFWTLSPNVGTISTAGLYTAPATVDAQQTIVVTATHTMDKITATSTITLFGPVSFWNSSVTPAIIDSGDSGSIEVGMKFRSDAAGSVAGVRFYKSAANTGPHTGHLWTNTGTLLGTVTFANETASGWQQANFATPISIVANTTYIISYFAPNGHSSQDPKLFARSGVDQPPLHALMDGLDGPNGLYQYNPNPTFPTSSTLSANYWVDVVFLPSSASAGQNTTIYMAPRINSSN
jgi:hypothetical protein